jgi:hypothetical protein
MGCAFVPMYHGELGGWLVRAPRCCSMFKMGFCFVVVLHLLVSNFFSSARLIVPPNHIEI